MDFNIVAVIDALGRQKRLIQLIQIKMFVWNVAIRRNQKMLKLFLKGS